VQCVNFLLHGKKGRSDKAELQLLENENNKKKFALNILRAIIYQQISLISINSHEKL
jgi:hypothetical protein